MRAEILEQILAVSSQYTGLTDHERLAQRDQLVELTDQAAAGLDLAAEYERFVGVMDRSLKIPAKRHEKIIGATVLVTGGTGTVGRRLICELVTRGAGRVICLSRGVTPYEPVAGVEYRAVDVTDAAAIDAVMSEIEPDVVFHLAAVRSPKEAERAPDRAVRTNVGGTNNVVRAARQAEVGTFVFASTGKAVRLYTTNVYAATKKVGEWLIRRASPYMPVAGVRFTHVVDNSIIHAKLKDDLGRGVITLHGPYMAMHSQSARESAELLIEATDHASLGEASLLSIRDLEYPFDITDVALGLRESFGSSVPLVYEGFEPGYEEHDYPGLYDMRIGDTGPLVNRFEASRTRELYGDVINCMAEPPAAPLPEGRRLLRAIDGVGSHDVVAKLDALSQAILRDRLLHEDPAQVAVVLRIASRLPDLTSDHGVITGVLRDIERSRVLAPAAS